MFSHLSETLSLLFSWGMELQSYTFVLIPFTIAKGTMFPNVANKVQSSPNTPEVQQEKSDLAKHTNSFLGNEVC